MPGDGDGDRVDQHPHHPLVWVAVALAAIVVAVGAAVALSQPEEPQRDPEVRTYVIEAGTADRIKAGEQVSAIPTEIALRVGDKLVVRNEDRKEFEVGPYLVRPGDTLEQEFQRPQTLIGECLVTTTGQVRIDVTE